MNDDDDDKVATINCSYTSLYPISTPYLILERGMFVGNQRFAVHIVDFTFLQQF